MKTYLSIALIAATITSPSIHAMNRTFQSSNLIPKRLFEAHHGQYTDAQYNKVHKHMVDYVNKNGGSVRLAVMGDGNDNMKFSVTGLSEEKIAELLKQCREKGVTDMHIH